ncbi:hypothetical protein C8F01DRAFT_552885 [Mycena amicta]|nr:hypothetical protein C8F01DRAFT_552885 [Mycena amicta]
MRQEGRKIPSANNLSIGATRSKDSALHVVRKKMDDLLASEEHKTLERWLKPADVAINQREAQEKRHPGTGNWFINSRVEFAEWKYTPAAVLWLYGMPGSGKTVLSSTIIETLRENAELHAFFYFNTNNREQCTIAQLLSTLAMQLSVQVSLPHKTLLALWETHHKPQHLLGNAKLLTEALIPLLEQLATARPVYLVLDALDECTECDKLLDLLEKLVDPSRPNVHLLVTSRPEVSVPNKLERCTTTVTIDRSSSTDIDSYLNDALSKCGGWIQKNVAIVKESLMDCGNGTFRLASLQVDDLRDCEGSKLSVEEALANMPGTLNEMYDHILNKITNARMQLAVARAMNWLIFSRRPMTLLAIIDALAFDFRQVPLRFDAEQRMKPDALLKACSGLVSVVEDAGIRTISLAHASVKEYLASTDKFQGPREDVEISEPAAHYLFARTCIGYFSGIDGVLESVEGYPLLDYAVENWATHFNLCADIKTVKECQANPQLQDDMRLSRAKTLIDTAMGVLRPGTPQYTNFCRFSSARWSYFWSVHDGRKNDVARDDPVYLCACLGIPSLLYALLQREGDNRGYGFMLIQWATTYRPFEIPMISVLALEHRTGGAERGKWHGRTLLQAVNSQSIAAVSLLLGHGLDVNGCEWPTLEKPLHAAVLTKSTEIVRLLLEHRADVNAPGKSHNKPLAAALHAQHQLEWTPKCPAGCSGLPVHGYCSGVTAARCRHQHAHYKPAPHCVGQPVH